MIDLSQLDHPVEHAVLYLAVGVLVVLIVAVWLAMRRTRARLREVEARERELQPLASPVRRLEQELGMLIDFIRGFPRLLDQLQRLTEVRRIPGVLVNAMIHSFGAEQAVVLVRRRGPVEGDPGQDRLVVAALATSERGLKVGSEVPLGEGQLGIVADVQRVLDRGDYLPEAGIGVPGVNHSREAIFDVVAPMVVAEQTVGVIGFSRPARVHPQQKEMLQVIAQLGAVTWRNLSTFRTVKHAAEVDELTGVFNKAALKLKLSETVYEARERGATVSVFLFDIDNFKSYNDTNGHLAGDKLLQELAELVQNSIRSDDIFGRFGGEEFLLILPNVTLSQAVLVAEKVRRLIAGHAFAYAASQPLGMVSISGGVAEYPFDGLDAAALVKTADDALYQAKRKGRNQVVAPVRRIAPDQPAETVAENREPSSRRAGDDS